MLISPSQREKIKRAIVDGDNRTLEDILDCAGGRGVYAGPVRTRYRMKDLGTPSAKGGEQGQQDRPRRAR